MDALAECSSELIEARELLISQLREHALVIGEVTLTSGKRAQYYVDAKRAILRPECFAALSRLVAAQVSCWRGTAVASPPWNRLAMNCWMRWVRAASATAALRALVTRTVKNAISETVRAKTTSAAATEARLRATNFLVRYHQVSA